MEEDTDDTGAQQIVPFIERSAELTKFITDKRIYQIVTNLLGKDFLWVASEGNLTTKTRHEWHPDRTGTKRQVEFKRLKVMFYLDSVRRESGCLRVIPGSHHYSFHSALFNSTGSQSGMGYGSDVSDVSAVCGVRGDELNAQYVESDPGDVLFFNQSLWHSVYEASPGRRYVSALFTERPTHEEHFQSLKHYTPQMFTPHENFLNSADKKIRDIVDPVVDL